MTSTEQQNPERAPLEVRRLVPVIEPTEFVRVDPDRIVDVAQWLSDRGVRCELRFSDRGGSPTLCTPGAMGPHAVSAGSWLGVQGGIFRGTFAAEQLASWQDAEVQA